MKIEVRLKSPVKPFSTLKEAKKIMAPYSKELRDSGFFPCLRCHGSGSVIDPDAVPDAYEGHKLSRRISCPMCDGTLRIPKEQFKKWYDEQLEKYTKEKAKYDEEVGRVKEIARELSATDIQLLRKYL